MAIKHGLYLTSRQLEILSKLLDNAVMGNECIEDDNHLSEVEAIEKITEDFLILLDSDK